MCQQCVEQAEAYATIGVKESERILAHFGMTLSKALEKLQPIPVDQ